MINDLDDKKKEALRLTWERARCFEVQVKGQGFSTQDVWLPKQDVWLPSTNMQTRSLQLLQRRPVRCMLGKVLAGICDGGGGGGSKQLLTGQRWCADDRRRRHVRRAAIMVQCSNIPAVPSATHQHAPRQVAA